MLQQKYSFWDIGEYKQAKSNNEAECERNLQCSCARCNRAWRCNEQRCTIYQRYKLRLLELQVQRVGIKRESEDYIVHTRKYKITPMNERKRQAFRKFNQLYKKNEINKQKELILDDISVRIESDDFESALTLMIKVGLKKTAKTIAPILRKKIFVEKLLKENK